MLAEVREPVETDERRGRGRDEHLPAVADRRDAGGAVHVISDVAFVRHERRACVQADAHMDRAGRQRLRKPGSSCESAGRRRKGEEERIALGVDLDPALGRTRLPISRRCSASAFAYASAPSECRSFVEPSTSVKRKVTVPVGRSSRTRRDHPPAGTTRPVAAAPAR